MELGLFLMPLHYPRRPHYETYQEDLELVAYADKLGFAETWVGEHFTLPWENMPSPEMFIARCLGVTGQMYFGTGVSLLHYHDPVHVAHRIAQLDHLSKGRIYFGVGSAAGPTDLEMFHLDTSKGTTRERMEESLEIILKVWKGEPFDYQGKFFHTTLPKPRPEARLGFHMYPYQKPHPPIALAGSSPRSSTLNLVGERGWIPLSTCFLYDSYLPSHWDVVEEGAKRVARRMDRSIWRISREMHVAKTTKQAREEVLNGPIAKFFVDYWIPLLANLPGGISALKHEPSVPDSAVTPEYMLEHFWIVGDPDYVTRRVIDLHKKVGGFGTLLPLAHDWEKDRKKWFNSLELMAKEVLPAVNKAIPAKV